MDKSSFFWLGGISSFGLYAALVALLVFGLTTSNIKKISIKSEQSTIEVSMEDLPVQPTPQLEKPAEPEPQKIEQKKPEKIIEEAIAPKKIIKDAIKKEEPKKAQPTTPKQTQPAEQQKSAKDIFSSLSIKKNSEVSFSSSNTSGEASEYLSKITKIIKQGWGTSQAEAGIVVIVAMSIEANGAFSFRIKSGGNPAFNERLNAHLKSLQAKGFPPTTDKKPISVEFNFKAK